MKKTFEIISGLLVLAFMVVVLVKISPHMRPADTPEPLPTDTETPDGFGYVESVSTFRFMLEETVRSEVGRPIEGYEPAMFMQVFPGLSPADFAGVEAMIGKYVYEGGVLRHELGEVTLVHSAAPAITEAGMETLFKNVARRLEVDPARVLVADMIARLKNKPADSNQLPVACTADAKKCPDGSYVGRTGRNCSFAACPTSLPASAEVFCSPETKESGVCIELYAPVCGRVQVQCITTPCEPVRETFSNSCFACAQGNVLSYTKGACEE